MQRIAIFSLRFLCAVALVFSTIALGSGSVRSALVSVICRKIAGIWPPKYAFIGDSLTADCGLPWRFANLPFEAISLARGGADIRAVGLQAASAVALHPKFLFITAGVNDLILDQAPPEQIAADFKLLLANVPAGQKTILTSIPYLSDKTKAADITAANNAISKLATQRGLPLIDLNSILSSSGVRKPGMTTDGIHFTERACVAWADMIRAKLALEEK
jgi:lysophospholipase L1-like esterase